MVNSNYRLIVATLFTLLTGFMAVPAMGQTPTQLVVVISTDTTDEIFTAIAQELRSYGFEVTESRMTVAGGQAIKLEEIARRAGAIAAVRVDTPAQHVEIWVADLVTGKTVSRRLGSMGEEDLNPPLIGLATAELLRASLLEVRTKHRTKTTSDAPPKAVETMIDSEPAGTGHSGLWFALSAGPILSSFDMAPGISLIGALRLRFEGRWAVALSGSAPVYPSRGEWAQGSVEVNHGIFGAEASLLLAQGGGLRSVRWDIGLGASLVVVKSVGRAERGYIDRENSTVTGLPHLRTGLSFALTDYLDLRADLTGGPTFHKIAVAIDNREVTSMGSFFVLAIGLDIRLLELL